tara:strand:+ start:367 stop:834 length:468 start_codon:yes stop_codon:yes gene_type:complete
MNWIRQSNWDIKYLGLAEYISTWSKDPSTKIGAVAIGTKGQVLSQGYNGFPRGIIDSPERLNTREEKYKYVVHAEMNVIFNASLNGVSLYESTMYICGLPCCSDCAKGMIQAGISRVVMKVEDLDGALRWEDSWNRSKNMFNETGIEWNLNGITS